MYHVLAQCNPLRRAFLLAAVLAGMALALPARAWALTYTFTTLDVPGSSLTEAYGINNVGQIVGNFVDATGYHGFLYTGGSFITINVPGSSDTFALGINTAGQTVGAFADATGRRHGFLYTAGQFTTIDVPGSAGTYAYGINNKGQIAGVFYDAMGEHGFLFSGGDFITLDVPGSTVTFARGINAAGQIVGLFGDAMGGLYGFLYTGGSFAIIDVPGSSETIASGINTAGQIVGFFRVGSSCCGHGFVDPGGSFTTIDVPGSSHTFAEGINDTGQIVGLFTATGEHGFIATPVPTSPPMINVSATPETLWPPNGKLVPVTVSGTITDDGSDVASDTATYAVTDEYASVQPSGTFSVRSDGSYAFPIDLQASRNGNDRDGREYIITVYAKDTAGNTGSAATRVIVPHD